LQSFFLIKRITILLLSALFFTTGYTQQQSRFSIATDLDIQRNFKEGQLYWAIGSTVQALFHLTPKEGIYAWFAWFSNGEFENDVTATAKSPLTIPQQVHYTNSARMKLKQFSTGYRRYLKGTPDAEEGWNLYAYAGFGLVIGSVENIHSVSPDTTAYAVPVFGGKGRFKRLTLDLGAGYEFPLGGDFYFYAEARVWVPTTDYPSKFIFANNNAPFVGMLGAGVRIIF
jgi:hypothetical protein